MSASRSHRLTLRMWIANTTGSRTTFFTNAFCSTDSSLLFFVFICYWAHCFEQLNERERLAIFAGQFSPPTTARSLRLTLKWRGNQNQPAGLHLSEYFHHQRVGPSNKRINAPILGRANCHTWVANRYTALCSWYRREDDPRDDNNNLASQLRTEPEP